MIEGNDVYSLKNITYMIKMCTYKGTEEQPRMHDNDVDFLTMRSRFISSIR